MKTKLSILRTKGERRNEITEIIRQLCQFELNAANEPMKKLYTLFREYIEEGKDVKVNIPHPMIKCRIKGMLAMSIKEEVWIKLQHEEF